MAVRVEKHLPRLYPTWGALQIQSQNTRVDLSNELPYTGLALNGLRIRSRPEALFWQRRDFDDGSNLAHQRDQANGDD
jgi:hypothetical protein